MAKKSITFKNMNKEAVNSLQLFVIATTQQVKENARHKKVVDPIKQKINSKLQSRQEAIDNGMSYNSAIEKFDTFEETQELRKLNYKHSEIMKALNETIKKSYEFLPENLYDSYIVKIEQSKNGLFLTAISQFLENIGIENTTQAGVRNLATQISDKIGVKVSSLSTIQKKGTFTSRLTTQQFNKLFISVYIDILSNANIQGFTQDEIIKLCNEDSKTEKTA